MSKSRIRRSPFRRPQANLRLAVAGPVTEVLFYDEIGWWGITADDFARELATITTPEILLRVNSPGGEIFDGIAIYNALREHPAKVTTRVDALAASMASLVALAGDTVEMADNAFFMVHNPWSVVIGDSAAMRQEADLLDKLSGSLVSAYVARSGKPEDEVRGLMDAETWMSAAEAVDFGFADAVRDADEDADEPASVAALFDLSVFANLPERLRETEDHKPTTRDLERALRDAGLSQIAAKQYVSAGREAASQRDAEEAGARDVTPEPARVFHPIGT